MEAELKWQGKFAFQTKIRNHEFTFDTQSTSGGENLGPSPKEVLLSSIAACSGMDVASLMTKMRVEFEQFTIHAEAETTQDHPKVFKQVKIEYKITGKNPDLSKIQKSVEMSLSKYCGVSAMVSKVSPIVYEIQINGEKRAEGRAHFWET